MRIYKIVKCYAEDEKIYYVFPYNLSYKHLKLFGGTMNLFRWLRYAFINSSLTEKKANKKLAKIKTR